MIEGHFNLAAGTEVRFMADVVVAGVSVTDGAQLGLPADMVGTNFFPGLGGRAGG
jgi:hypothetical protein